MRRDGAKRGFKVSDVAIDGEVIEADPPRKLVLSWRMVMDAETTAEGFTRLTYEIAESQGGITRLTLVHDLGGTQRVASILSGEWEAQGAGGGWSWVP